MDAYETLNFIDNLLLELGYTDNNKSNYDDELYNGIEALGYLDALEIENKNLTSQNSELIKENKKLKANFD